MVMAYTEIRPARPEDRNAVLAFCAHTWEWGDYIEYVWDEWLHDPQGQMFVATVDGQAVGVAHFRMLSATEAWLEGMRIDPAYRQQGLATAINNTMLAEAMKRGATVARLITESTNTAAIRATGHSFMRQVGAFVPFRAMPVTTAPKSEYGMERPQLATTADIDEIVDYLNASNIFPAVGGLYYLGFTAYAITNDLLEAKVQAKHVYLLRRWDRLDGLAIAEPRQGRHDNHLFIGYIDGTTEAISLIAYALRRMVHDMGLESVSAHAPDLMMVRDAFVGAEYEWDGKVFYTYERRLT
jgi:GNAT superfamily N-acetyltransferase